MICQKAKTIPCKAPSLQSTAVGRPFQCVYADHLGPLQKVDNKTHILVLIDRFSRWTELIPVTDVKAETTARAVFSRWICQHGPPTAFATDNGSSFTGHSVSDVCRVLNIEHHLNTPLLYSNPLKGEKGIKVTQNQAT